MITNNSFEEEIHQYFSSNDYAKAGIRGIEHIFDATNEKMLIDMFVSPNTVYEGVRVPLVQDFSVNHEMVFSGCSETTGEYLSKDLGKPDAEAALWGCKVANKFELDFLSYGMGAGSAYSIVQKLLALFAEVGNPKILLCLFPDFYRLTMPQDPLLLVGEMESKTTSAVQQVQLKGFKSVDAPKYSKKPHRKEDVIPAIVPLWQSIQSILMLEKYCSAAGIKLKYGTWHSESESFMDTMNNYMIKNYGTKPYKNFIRVSETEWYKDSEVPGCHESLRQSAPDLFKKGTDGTHMGTHRHAHIADFFIAELEKEL